MQRSLKRARSSDAPLTNACPMQDEEEENISKEGGNNSNKSMEEENAALLGTFRSFKDRIISMQDSMLEIENEIRSKNRSVL